MVIRQRTEKVTEPKTHTQWLVSAVLISATNMGTLSNRTNVSGSSGVMIAMHHCARGLVMLLRRRELEIDFEPESAKGLLWF